MPSRRGKRNRSAATELLQRIEHRNARLGVVGLGYVGLPLAMELGQAGFHVAGLDIDEKRVAELRKSRSYIQDVPSAILAKLVKSGKFFPTTDFSTLRSVDAVNVLRRLPNGAPRCAPYA